MLEHRCTAAVSGAAVVAALIVFVLLSTAASPELFFTFAFFLDYDVDGEAKGGRGVTTQG